MPTDEKRYAELAKSLRNFDYLLIDTCSLMDDNFPDWMNAFELAKREYLDDVYPDFRAIVPYRCFEELKRHAKSRPLDHSLAEKKIAAKRALRIVKWAKLKRIIEITKKDKSENYADNAITVKVIHDRLSMRILVMTQDKGLASDLLYWNRSQSQRGKFISVVQLIDHGYLVPNRGKPVPTARENNPANPYNPNKPRTPRESFHATPIPKQANQSQPNPAPVQPNKTASYDFVAVERRLRSTVSNPNYPLEKKKKEVSDYLDHLSNLSPATRTALGLTVPEEDFRRFLITGVFMVTKPAKPASKPENPAKTTPNSTPAPVATDPFAKVRGLRYEEGMSVKEALSNAASSQNVMFRYFSIPYEPQFHGAVDLTNIDLDNIANELKPLLGSAPLVSVQYHNVIWYLSQRGNSYRAWLDVSQANSQPSKPVEKPKKPAEPSPNKPKKKTKAEKPAVEKPVEETSPKPKKTKAKAKVEKPAIPEPTPEKPKKQAASKKPANPAETEKKPAAAKKPATKKPAEPTKKPTSKKLEAAKKPAEASKKPTTPKKPKAEKPAPTPKPEPTKKPKLTALEEAIASEKRLKANTNNPNYPVDSKLADLKAQLARVKRLKIEDRKQLTLSVDTLKMMISMFESSK